MVQDTERNMFCTVLISSLAFASLSFLPASVTYLLIDGESDCMFAGALSAATLGMISLSRGTDTPSTVTAAPPAPMSPPPVREQYLIPRAVQNSAAGLGAFNVSASSLWTACPVMCS